MIERVLDGVPIHPARPGDAVDGVQPRFVAEPGSYEEAARVLALANENALRTAPRGGGTKLGWGSAPAGLDMVVSTKRFDCVVEHAHEDLTATVQAGCAIAEFQRILAGRGQRLALDPLWPDRATIGGVVAANDSGPLRWRFGALRNLILGITVALPDGTLARSGGKVVKNVAGYDLPKLFTGSFGTLGLVLEATFRLHPLPRAVRDASFRTPSAASARQFLLSIADSTLAPACVQIRAGDDGPIEIDVRFEGAGAVLDEHADRLARLAANDHQTDTPPSVWRAFERLWDESGAALLCKANVPPASLGDLLESLQRLAPRQQFRWRLVAQGDGAGALRIDGDSDEALLSAIEPLREAIRALDGSFVVLQCPASIKPRADVWGPAGDALPLMRRVKQQFDPRSILNSGRFVVRDPWSVVRGP